MLGVAGKDQQLGGGTSISPEGFCGMLSAKRSFRNGITALAETTAIGVAER